MTREEAQAAFDEIVKMLADAGIDPPIPPRLEEEQGVFGPEYEIHVRAGMEDEPDQPTFERAVRTINAIERRGRELGFRPAIGLVFTILHAAKTD